MEICENNADKSGVLDTERTQESIFYGAGMLCYSVSPVDNEVFFLLGKESGPEDPILKKPWCDFAGGMEDGESIEDTAAREFIEESLGLVGIEGSSITYPSIIDVSSALKSARYTFAVNTCVNWGAINGCPKKYHVTFVKQIPWTASLPSEFALLRKYLDDLQAKYERLLTIIRRIETDPQSHSYPLERRSLSGDYLAKISTNLSRQLEGEWIVDKIEVNPYKMDVEKKWKAILTIHRQPSQETCVLEIDSEGEPFKDDLLNEYMIARMDISTYYNLLPDKVKQHPAISIDERGIANVKSHYMEKQAIQYWSLNRLKDVLSKGGRYKREYIRPSFIPTLATILDIFRNGKPIGDTSRYMVYCRPKVLVTESISEIKDKSPEDGDSSEESQDLTTPCVPLDK